MNIFLFFYLKIILSLLIYNEIYKINFIYFYLSLFIDLELYLKYN